MCLIKPHKEDVLKPDMEFKQEQLKQIIAVLDKHMQRATYGAVADVVGLQAQSVMNGKPKDHKHSWVVTKTTGLPTGYSQAELHPMLLLSNPDVISSAKELEKWLITHA